MLHFTKLKLQGFKSFVERTELVIGPGMTGIVGPNGCGKSNLVEALRWVMGETSAKRMRGSAMDDVIFGGTTMRPARNLAEVTLVLDNQQRMATAEFNHDDVIEVVRQIERAGGSDYRVNGRPTRQRDVQLLFADLSTGAHSTSLVGQGQIDALIRAKPQDRRQILEEASGTAGLQARRHEAELKLRGAEQNLTRVDDVLNALEGQLRSLKTQVRQASRYRNLAEHIRRTEAVLAHLRWLAAEAQHEHSRVAFAAVETAVNDWLVVVTRGTTARTEAAAGLPALRQAETVAAAVVQRLALAREQIEGELKRIAQETAQHQQLYNQALSDKAREEMLQRDGQQAIETLATEDTRLAGELQALAANLPTAQAELAAIHAVVQNLEQNLQALTETIAADEAKHTALQRSLLDVAKRRDTMQARRDEFARQRDALAAENATRPDLSLAQSMIEACEQDVQKRQQHVENTEANLAATETAHQTAQQILREHDGQVTRHRAERDALQNLLRSNLGTHKPVLDALQVAPGLEAALAAALGEALSSPLDHEAAAHWQDLPPLATVPALPAGVMALADAIQAPAALSRALSQIGVVDDVASGKILAAALLPGQILVSRDGWAWRWDGYTVTAAAPTAAAVRLQQRNRLAVVQAELLAAETALQNAQAAATASTAKRTVAQQELSAARQAQQQAYKALNDAQQHHARHAQAAAATQSKLAALDEALAHAQHDAATLAQQHEQVAAEITALPDLSAARREQDGLRLQLAEQRQIHITRRGAVDNAAREQQNLTTRRQQVAADSQSWRNRTAAAEKHLLTLAERIAELTGALAALATKPERLQAERATLLTQAAEAETHRKAAADALMSAETHLFEIEQQLKRDETALMTAKEDRVRAEAAVAAAIEHSRVLAASIAEKLDCLPHEALALADYDPADPMPEPSELEQSLSKYLREREAMGPVNLRAEVEAETVETERNKLQTEKNDLVKAIATLRQAISHLNKEARERLGEAFAKVDERFQTLFKRLFGGGKAHLQLVDADDPLNAGLEIFAAPPGKKVQILSLLSGGERSLTALALLFAVFQTNPSPICVLDEAEAALDEGNVDRFCSLVADIARETSTRFLVITHQRLTMARMDRLFGVTMSEKGVSQLVSVDLSQAEAVRDGVMPPNLALAAAE